MQLEDLIAQVHELKSLNEIKDITYQYWYAVDTKNVDMLREVFAPGEIYINYQDCPVWTSRNDFMDFYCSLALDDSRQENHFGSSPRIKILGPTSAIGNWRLNMFAYNFATRTVMRVTGEYDNEYDCVDGQWKIRKSVFKRHSLFSENISIGGEVNVPDFGGISADAQEHLYGNQ